MVALRGGMTRYGIERRMKAVGEIEKVIYMDIRVRIIGTAEDERSNVEYEIEANPAVWSVVDRKRGPLQISPGTEEGGGAKATTKLLPVRGGTLAASKLRLYKLDGRLCADIEIVECEPLSVSVTSEAFESAEPDDY